jgi:hypothetical protein
VGQPFLEAWIGQRPPTFRFQAEQRGYQRLRDEPAAVWTETSTIIGQPPGEQVFQARRSGCGAVFDGVRRSWLQGLSSSHRE